MDIMKTTQGLRELANTINELTDKKAHYIDKINEIVMELTELESYYKTEVIRLLNLKGELE